MKWFWLEFNWQGVKVKVALRSRFLPRRGEKIRVDIETMLNKHCRESFVLSAAAYGPGWNISDFDGVTCAERAGEVVDFDKMREMWEDLVETLTEGSSPTIQVTDVTYDFVMDEEAPVRLTGVIVEA